MTFKNILNLSPKTKDKIYHFVENRENFKDKMKILPVDFELPWWDIILQQKKLGICVFIVQCIWNIFESLLPITIGYAIIKLDLALFISIVAFRIFLIWVYNSTQSLNAVFQIQSISGVEFSAHKYFLTVDPIFHTTKSTGQIIAKIHRGSGAYEDVLDIITFDILSISTSIITVIITMFAFGWQLGLVALVFLLFILIFNISAQIIRTSIFQPIKIKTQDAYKAISVETLMQAPFIRAIFGSDQQISKIHKTTQNFMVKEGNSWQSGAYVGFVTRFIYGLSVIVLGSVVLTQAKAGVFEPTLALSIILTYTGGTSGVISVGDKVKRLTTALSNITDLFDFIRSFGKQTFPVLESDTHIQDCNKLSA